MLRRRLCLVILIVGLLFFGVLSPKASSDLKYTYVLYPDGHADIKVICNVSGRDFLELKLEDGYVSETIIVFSDSGMPLPHVLEADGRIIIDTSNLSMVIIEYEAIVGSVFAEVQVDVFINPLGPAEVILPLNSALLYFNGSPRVATVGDPAGKQSYIVLSYEKAGAYELSFLLLPQTDTFTGTPGTQTTTPPGVTGMFNMYVLVLVGVAAAALLGYFIMRKGFKKASEVEPLLEHGFDERDKAILKALSYGETTLSDLSRMTRLNKSVVWRRLEKLRELGYVEKSYSRGESVYVLTQKGLKILKDLGDQ